MDEKLEQYVIYEILNVLEIIYNIPRDKAIKYLRDNRGFIDNTIDRMDETLNREVEEWIPSTDIISHQRKDK